MLVSYNFLDFLGVFCRLFRLKKGSKLKYKPVFCVCCLNKPFKFNKMKRNLFILFISSFVLFSCSTDENNQDDIDDPSTAIIGSWRAIEFQAADPNNSTLNLGAEILDNLTAEECYILTFIFNSDLTVMVENAVNFVVPNATPNGLSVECPTQSNTESSTYTYDGTILTIVDQNGEMQSIQVTIEGDIMTVNATDLDVDNLNADGSVIFERF